MPGIYCQRLHDAAQRSGLIRPPEGLGQRFIEAVDERADPGGRAFLGRRPPRRMTFHTGVENPTSTWLTQGACSGMNWKTCGSL